jgi:hypothetical protein
MKCGHRVKPTIKAEHVFIEIGLQMFRLDTAMVRSLNPSLHVAEDEVDHGQVCLCLFRIACERKHFMAVSHLRNFIVAAPSVCADGSARSNIIFDKASKCFSTSVRYDAKSQASSVNAAFFVRFAVILMRPNLYGTDYNRFMVRAATLSARLAADIAFIDFGRILTTDSVTLRTNHTRAELVQDLEGRLIPSKAELALKLDSGLSGCLRSHEVCTPKPRREGCMARLHDGAGRKRCVDLAAATAQHYRRTRREAIWFSDQPAFWACKTL